MSSNDESPPEPIVWRLHLASSPETVFEALTTDAGRESFWAESAVEQDGVIHFRFINGVEDQSPIISRQRPGLFELEYFGTLVRFDVADAGTGGSDLTMTNSNYDPTWRDDLLPGWLNVLLPMKAMLDFGVDLRNHDPARTWDQRYVDH